MGNKTFVRLNGHKLVKMAAEEKRERAAVKAAKFQKSIQDICLKCAN